MWWHNFLWGFWNGLTAWLVLLVHACGRWRRYPVYNTARRGNWYDAGFVLGVASLRGPARGSGRNAGR